MSNHININVTEFRSRHLTDENTGLNVHDGLKEKTVSELKHLTAETVFPFQVCCLNLTSDLNISTIIRSSHLFGAEKVVVFGRRKIDNRGLVGAAHYTTVDKVWGIKENCFEIDEELFYDYCNSHKLFPVFIEQGGTNVYEYDWQSMNNTVMSDGMKPFLVLGTENSGIPEKVIKMFEKYDIVSIPQRGVLRSFNCSAAFSVVMSQMIGKLGWY